MILTKIRIRTITLYCHVGSGYFTELLSMAQEGVVGRRSKVVRSQYTLIKLCLLAIIRMVINSTKIQLNLSELKRLDLHFRLHHFTFFSIFFSGEAPPIPIQSREIPPGRIVLSTRPFGPREPPSHTG